MIVGCDVAKHTDWTVLVAIDARTGRCLEMERFNQLDWPVQRVRIAAFARRWRARLVMDATGVGDPVFDDLCRVLPQVEGFKITGNSKRELVQGLMVAVEQRRVAWPAAKRMKDEVGGRRTEDGGQRGCGDFNAEAQRRGEEYRTLNAERGGGDWEVLTAEMKRYEYEIGPTGQVSYSAPAGYHDDCVMAFALAVWGVKTFGTGPGRMLRLVNSDSAGLATLRRTLTLA